MRIFLYLRQYIHFNLGSEPTQHAYCVFGNGCDCCVPIIQNDSRKPGIKHLFFTSKLSRNLNLSVGEQSFQPESKISSQSAFYFPFNGIHLLSLCKVVSRQSHFLHKLVFCSQMWLLYKRVWEVPSLPLTVEVKLIYDAIDLPKVCG